MLQQRKYITLMVLHKGKDRTECGKYRDILMVAHGGKILLKIIARRFSEHCERVGIRSGGTEGFPAEPFYHRYEVCESSATGAGAEGRTFPVRMLYRPYAKAHGSVDRTLLWTVLGCF